jgi:hypothetical protein
MKCIFKVMLMLAAIVGVTPLAAPAHAQATRTWVSGTGDDANPCSRTAPCKTFAGAQPKTATGGQIDCLDPGGFGSVTITKSLTIECSHGGGFGSVLVAGGNGIAVNAGATGVVILRGLDLDGLGQTSTPAQNGILFTSGLELHVEDCFIHGFQNAAITVTPAGTTNRLYVNRSYLLNSGNGLDVTPSSSAIVLAALDSDVIEQNTSGIDLNGSGASIYATVSNSTIANNTGAGTNSYGLTANVNSSVIMNNDVVYGNAGTGVNSNGSSTTVRVGGSTIYQNVVGVSATNGGILQSYKNNQISANGTDGTPITAFPGPNSQPLQ